MSKGRKDRKRSRIKRNRPPRGPVTLDETGPFPVPKPQVDQILFDRQVARLDSMTKQWMAKWPHGVTPKSYFERIMPPVTSAYKAGVRTRELLAQMEQYERDLTIPGFIEP